MTDFMRRCLLLVFALLSALGGSTADHSALRRVSLRPSYTYPYHLSIPLSSTHTLYHLPIPFIIYHESEEVGSITIPSLSRLCEAVELDLWKGYGVRGPKGGCRILVGEAALTGRQACSSIRRHLDSPLLIYAASSTLAWRSR